MRSKLILALLCSTLISSHVSAGLPEALEAFEAKQYTLALPEFTYLADENNDVALYYMGRLYNEGLGVTADPVKALNYFKRASDAYNADASYQAGKMLLDGIGAPADVAQAMVYLKKAGYAAHPQALYELGEIYANGKGGVEVNNVYAFGYYLMSALRGDMKAQHKLSQLYFEGKGTPQDYEKSLRWLARSANQGYVLAQRDLAELRSSNPQMVNFPDAYAWYSIIAAYNDDEVGQWAKERRDALVQSGKFRNVSDLLAKQQAATAWRPTSAAQSVPQDEVTSTPRPVIPGFNDPQTIQNVLLSGEILLVNGNRYGISSDTLHQAMDSGDWTAVNGLIETAAKKGDATAYGYMGDLMQKRMKDEKSAVKWYQKGAEAKEPYAQYQLAKMYCEGRGMENPDIPQCYRWLLTADQLAGPSMKFTIQNAIMDVKENASPEELAAGEQLVGSVAKSETGETSGKIGFSLF